MSDDIRNRASIHVDIDEAATADEADEFFTALGDWVAEWMEAHPDRGEWDPYVHMHTESCDDSDHCHGPGSWVEAQIKAKTLRDFADHTERELVCCDAYDGKSAAGKHAICYWGGAVVHEARRRADVAATWPPAVTQ